MEACLPISPRSSAKLAPRKHDQVLGLHSPVRHARGRIHPVREQVLGGDGVDERGLVPPAQGLKVLDEYAVDGNWPRPDGCRPNEQQQALRYLLLELGEGSQNSEEVTPKQPRHVRLADVL